jgi:predicted DNA binding CopG/RHH family protein
MTHVPRGNFDIKDLVDEGIIELPLEQHQEATRQTEIADGECRVNFRWGLAQIDVVKRVADLMGVPYQQYIKQVLFRQAYADLQRFGPTKDGKRSDNKYAEPVRAD